MNRIAKRIVGIASVALLASCGGGTDLTKEQALDRASHYLTVAQAEEKYSEANAHTKLEVKKATGAWAEGGAFGTFLPTKSEETDSKYVINPMQKEALEALFAYKAATNSQDAGYMTNIHVYADGQYGLKFSYDMDIKSVFGSMFEGVDVSGKMTAEGAVNDEGLPTVVKTAYEIETKGTLYDVDIAGAYSATTTVTIKYVGALK